MKKDPEERYTFDKLLYEHEFLKDINVEECKQAFIRDYQVYKGIDRPNSGCSIF